MSKTSAEFKGYSASAKKFMETEEYKAPTSMANLHKGKKKAPVKKAMAVKMVGPAMSGKSHYSGKSYKH